VLDDLKYIHQKDKSDALGVVGKQYQQLSQQYNVSVELKSDIRNVVLAGMGGSALPAVFLRSWPGVSVPLEIVRDYVRLLVM
jgi:glucose-6-phosphate isomerase